MPSPRRLSAHLKGGGLIAYPTESCYGLGCDPNNRHAVLRLLKLKHRPQRKGLILIASDYQQIARYINPLTQIEQLKLKHDGEQIKTNLMPALSSTPRWLRGEHNTLAIRLTAHLFAGQLCHRARNALVSTSANRSGQQPAKTFSVCQRMFGASVWVLRGLVGKRKQPSTICSWLSGKIIRQ
jgi:L-threonylcarbamoyladenylate synthase